MVWLQCVELRVKALPCRNASLHQTRSADA